MNPRSMFHNIIRKTVELFVATLLILAAAGPIYGCRERELNAPPFIPPSYYECMVATPQDLWKAYSSKYSNRAGVEIPYKDKPFIFKCVTITKDMLKHKDEGYIWVEAIKCIAMRDDFINHLTVGETIDIVGINRGLPQGLNGGLLMTECLFLPSGSVELPLPGNSGDTFVRPIY